DLNKGILDTILKGGNDFKGFALTEDGSKAAFVAERDAKAKDLQKFYKLYVYNGHDSAKSLIDKTAGGMQLGMTVSENGTVAFSKTGNRLFFGTAAIQPPKDTSLVEVDLVKLDIWHYKDDYLQSQQLFNLQNELKRSYLAVYDFAQQKMEQLGSKDLPTIIQTNEGDGVNFYAATDTGRRVQRQWGDTKTDVYAVEVGTGKKTLVKRNHEGQFYPSSTGKYILLYDAKAKHYFNWDGKSLKNITSKIKVPLYNEEHDSPSDPSAYGIMGWHEGDSAVYIYDRYDIWKVDPVGSLNPVNLTAYGRKNSIQYRYVRLNSDERFLKHSQSLYFRTQNQKTKKGGFAFGKLSKQINFYWVEKNSPYSFSLVAKAENADELIVSKENYTSSPDLYYYSITKALNSAGAEPQSVKLSSLNPQQSQYNWGTAELFKWKAFNGKMLDGILYKPEDFDSTKKYPMLIYFYERLSDGVYNYHAPSPTPSRINIPFYVSRGYLVFAPDITYTVGHPAKDAYNSVVSGAKALAKNKWVDVENIGIQGQSWGGIQVAQLITMTNMFKAAWAGAPVANMTSAYGGIRWESGVNRQFQYEKTQSRIGATLWQRPDLYIENSPLFHVPKIKTPLVIMSNDADGAVPWYQGIELFTAMRRLDKKVWMLNYNGEAHNLVERKNRKDIQMRQQQYFDWLLKGAKPARWITDGLPAIQKGKDRGFEVVL
ncbi:MAG: alpha/beta hydrolase family protein, partial [Chitinophagaceae bacterium]